DGEGHRGPLAPRLAQLPQQRPVSVDGVHLLPVAPERRLPRGEPDLVGTPQRRPGPPVTPPVRPEQDRPAAQPRGPPRRRRALTSVDRAATRPRWARRLPPSPSHRGPADRSLRRVPTAYKVRRSAVRRYTLPRAVR